MLGKCARGALETLFGGIVTVKRLVGMPKVRFISGRPRKAHPPEPLQLLLAL